jgi:hypothetical protein
MLLLLGMACKLYGNGNYMRVLSSILSGAPPSTHLLHDGVEDQEVPVEIRPGIRKTSCRYRHQKDERKRKQIETAPKKEQGGQTDQISRQTSNLRAIASSPAADWSVERRLEYIEWAKNVVAGLRGISPWLEQQFDEAVATAERSLYPALAGA